MRKRKELFTDSCWMGEAGDGMGYISHFIFFSRGSSTFNVMISTISRLLVRCSRDDGGGFYFETALFDQISLRISYIFSCNGFW